MNSRHLVKPLTDKILDEILHSIKILLPKFNLTQLNNLADTIIFEIQDREIIEQSLLNNKYQSNLPLDDSTN